MTPDRRRSFAATTTLAPLGPLVAALLLVACGSDAVLRPTHEAADLYWALRTNHHAVTMAVGETLQLTGTPVLPTGEPLAGLGEVTFASADTMNVKVDASGLLQARGTATRVRIVASLRSERHNRTNADTVWVNVTAQATPIATFTIEPDSTLIGSGSSYTFAARVRDAAGTNIPGISIIYGSTNPARLSVNATTGQTTAYALGTASVWARTTSYGVTTTDSVEITVTPTVSAIVRIDHMTFNSPTTPIYLANRSLTVRKWGSVVWRNSSLTPVQIVFQNPTGVNGGDVPAFNSSLTAGATRQFTSVGTYKYTIPEIGEAGEIVVVE